MAKKTIKQRIKLRETPTVENHLSLLLDWSKDNKRHREYLGIIAFAKPKNAVERHHNKEIY